MPELAPYIAVPVGLVLLFLGGEGLVHGAVALAKRLGMSPLLIGLTVVGAGTSAPELVVSVQAALDGQPDIALGNVVGSNIGNLLLILGIGAMIHPMRTSRAVVFRDGGVMLLATIIAVRLAVTGSFERWAGAAMLVGLVVYLGLAYWWERGHEAFHAEEAHEFEQPPLPLWAAGAAVVVGIGALVAGAHWLVSGAVIIATDAGVPEAVIGLTLVAIGTSLPELATTVIAALRRHTDIAVGNIIGSNIFNILGILSVTALVHPVPVSPQIMDVDVWVLLAVTVGAVPLLASGWVLSRREGALFFALYGTYMAWLFLGVPRLMG